ncbi:MAG: radical SAM protein [Pseudodesulfovibrio sp.]|jgi:wyosine [tRNA(Phe)-imidazoG37] synthetase (radical SAM superfamily)|uniref:Radical SAM protein n=1 Tax=Pseudodesulfovibrio indicus TaxID=1716143 RepID=A0A126QKX7_9BACT|nr:radical SAM protein [Pseudodesulfovibrio indicus]AMK10429.1 radical SAM protein [Pseudodesulfovibrio indicus]TDT89178.1 wyosine [tRNA(Phe)-imidazoG37] synthetase (radical SAM superfamily) [Pseudodesulfovibrio indicus]
MAYKYVFGPVMSGRLGRSLGLDLLGDRICSMDCVYCEVGATRDRTCERRVYVPAADILKELALWKEEGLEPPDMITLGGLGEPCLNLDMETIILGSRRLFPDTPVAVLTNASLMTDPQVRRELCAADVVLPSLDSLVGDEFAAVNRPDRTITPQAVAEGLLEFKKEFKGQIFLEILLAEGINDSDENLGLLQDFCKRLAPDRVDVVTLTRPGTVKGVRPVDGAVLSRWRLALGGGETRNRERSGTGGKEMSLERMTAAVTASLNRRPQTAEQLAQALGADPERVRQAVEALEKMGDVTRRDDRGQTFYHGTGHVIED